ncbi:MAG: hypothetical protein AB9917_13535 [Negativicutes bacterium]
MFVVHTVNQLEEAVRVGAEEILVTGGLASNVHEAYLSKTCTDKDGAMAATSANRQSMCENDSVTRRIGVPVWGVSSLMMITGEYVLLNSHLDPQSPSMILQRTTQH